MRLRFSGKFFIFTILNLTKNEHHQIITHLFSRNNKYHEAIKPCLLCGDGYVENFLLSELHLFYKLRQTRDSTFSLHFFFAETHNVLTPCVNLIYLIHFYEQMITCYQKFFLLAYVPTFICEQSHHAFLPFFFFNFLRSAFFS